MYRSVFRSPRIFSGNVRPTENAFWPVFRPHSFFLLYTVAWLVVGTCSRLASTAVVSSRSTRLLQEFFAFVAFTPAFFTGSSVTTAWALFECLDFTCFVST